MIDTLDHFKKELETRIEREFAEGNLNADHLIDSDGYIYLDNNDLEIDEIFDTLLLRADIPTSDLRYFDDLDYLLDFLDPSDLWILTNEHCMIDVHQLKLFGLKWINPSELVQ